MLILIYDQSIFFEEAFKVSFGPPNQVRSYENVVYDFPKKSMQGRLLHGMYILEMDPTITFKLMVVVPYYFTRILI